MGEDTNARRVTIHKRKKKEHERERRVPCGWFPSHVPSCVGGTPFLVGSFPSQAPEPRRLLSVGNNVDLARLQENSGARLKLKPAEPLGPGSQYSYLRVTRTRGDVDTIHIAPRETYIWNVLDIFGLVGNKSMPTPIVQTRQKSDEDEPKLGEEDRRAYHRCLKYRPEIACAVHEVSKTLASPGDADVRRLRRLGRYLLGTQKLGIMIRKSKDLNTSMHAPMQTGVEIESIESVPLAECSKKGQQHCESSRRVRVVKRFRAEKASTALR